MFRTRTAWQLLLVIVWSCLVNTLHKRATLHVLGINSSIFKDMSVKTRNFEGESIEGLFGKLTLGSQLTPESPIVRTDDDRLAQYVSFEGKVEASIQRIIATT